MIVDAASMKVEYTYNSESNILEVIVEVTNEKAGHKFPTDSPLRHLLLVVKATDELGNVLPLAAGSTIPVWGGVNKNIYGMEDFGGLPGSYYALILADRDTSVYPTAAYWNPTKLVSKDTRLAPKATDKSTYSFSTPADMNIKIDVQLVYRYAFIDLAATKGWKRPDVLVTSTSCTVVSTPGDPVKCVENP